MPNTINGIGKPVFSAITPSGTILRDGWTFPFCNVGGVQNEIQKSNQVIELDSGRLEQDVFGYRNRFVLDYSQKLDGVYCLQLMELLNLEMTGHRIFCKPTGLIEYEVIFSNASFLLQLLASSGKFVSMNGIVIELLAVELSSINWQTSIEPGDPQPIHAMDDWASV